MKPARIGLAFVLASACSFAHAETYACGADPATDAYQCFKPSELRELGGERYAPLYTGGPKGVERSNFTVHANCGAQVLVLKDRHGVKFGAGYFSSTAMSKQLGAELCAAVVPVQAKKKTN